MNRLKKILSLALTLVLALALSAPAFAAEEGAATTHTITITSQTDGHTYQAYQVFSGSLSTDGSLINIVWGENVDGAALLSALQTAGGDFAAVTDAQDVADVLADYSNDSAVLDAFAKVVAAHVTTPAATAGTAQEVNGEFVYTVSGLKDGYYFINETTFDVEPADNAYTKYILKVAGSDVAVTAKTDLPKVEKKVLQNDAGLLPNTWNDAADYNVGEDVRFRLVGLVPDMSNFDTYFYCFNDTLSQGLTFNNDVTVYFATGGDMDTVAADETLTGTTLSGYTVDTTDNGFTVTFSDLKTTADVTTGGYIVVEYTAELNAQANISTPSSPNPGNPNVVTLTYSNNPNVSGSGDTAYGETPEDEVVVFTFELPVNKVDQDGADLQGAEFALFLTAEAAQNAINTQDFTGALKFSGSNGDYLLDDASTTYVLVSDENAHYSLKGLDVGTYYLAEVTAPEGFNILTAPVPVTVSATYNNSQFVDQHVPGEEDDQLTGVTVNSGSALNVENRSGATLPSTGGMGTALFTLGGLALMAGAVVLLVTKRKLKDDDQ